MRILSACCLTAAAIAISPADEAKAAAYKCEVNGRTAYQSTPCKGELGTIQESVEQRMEQERAQREFEERQKIVREKAAESRRKAAEFEAKIKADQRKDAYAWSAKLLSTDVNSISSIINLIESKVSSHYRDSEEVCSSEWTKRGSLDRRMYSYCIDQQRDSGKELSSLISEHGTSKYYPTALAYCYFEWNKRNVINVRMINHCMEQEVEGWRDIEYYKRTLDSSAVHRISLQGFARYESWRMAAYHLKRSLGIN